MTTGGPEDPPIQPVMRALGWLLHLYTASGAVLALLAVLAAIQGDSVRALWIFLVALVIDGTDGLLARLLQVKRHVPDLDGARLDDIVDYLTYVFAPVVLLLTTGRLPGSPWGEILAAAVLLSSCIQFCRTDAKTEDHFFLGFPSYWNVVAFYAIVLGLSPFVLGIVLSVCVILVFVPIKYLYPSVRPPAACSTSRWPGCGWCSTSSSWPPCRTRRRSSWRCRWRTWPTTGSPACCTRSALPDDRWVPRCRPDRMGFVAW